MREKFTEYKRNVRVRGNKSNPVVELINRHFPSLKSRVGRAWPADRKLPFQRPTGGTSVLLNFTDFPSPLYRFIYYRPVACIISISVKQQGIVGDIYDRFTWCPSLPPLHLFVLTRSSCSREIDDPCGPRTRSSAFAYIIIYRVLLLALRT